MTQSFEHVATSEIELIRSPHGTYTIFDLPGATLRVAENIVAGLQEQAFTVRLLQGVDRPDGMSSPYGMWPHPDARAIELMRQETGMEIILPEDHLVSLGRVAIEAA